MIENALDAGALAALKRELDPWFARAHCGEGQFFFGRNTLRFGGLFAKAKSAARLAIHPLVLPLMECGLKGDPAQPTCDAIELNLTQGIGIQPGEPAQFLHRDEDIWPFPDTFEMMSNAMWAIDDFTEENGATRLIPGSHLWPRDRRAAAGRGVASGGTRGLSGSVVRRHTARRRCEPLGCGAAGRGDELSPGLDRAQRKAAAFDAAGHRAAVAGETAEADRLSDPAARISAGSRATIRSSGCTAVSATSRRCRTTCRRCRRRSSPTSTRRRRSTSAIWHSRFRDHE